jgi:hypothetical protein
MDVILRGATQTENIGDRLMSVVANALFKDLAVENTYRLNHKGKGLRDIPDLHKVEAIFDLGNIHYCDTWPKPLEDRLRNSIRFNQDVSNAVPVFLPCGWGPYRPEHRELLDELTQGAIVFARDRISLRFLNDALGEDRATLCPDLALMCEPEDPACGRRLLSELGLSSEQPILGLIPNSRCVEEGVTPLADPTQYHRHLRSVVSWAGDNGYQVVGISHMVGTDRDTKLLNDLNIPIVQSDIPSMVRSVIANLDAAVCSRYHGLVNCLVHGVPPISLGWHHKYSGLMELFDLLDFDHPLEHDESELVARLNNLSANQGQLVQRLHKRVDEARSEIRGCMGSMSVRLGGPPEVLLNPVIVDDTGIEPLKRHRKTRFQRLLRRMKPSRS